MREHVRSGTEVVDGLRGLAILLVLLYHTWLFSWLTPEFSLFGVALPLAVPLRSGYLGVELFFVISGFVLFFPHAVRAIGGGAQQSLRDFAQRRLLKIVPSYAIALGATALVAIALVKTPATFFGALANHAFFVQNFFNDAFGKTNSVFWSLAIEVQFYLFFPAIAWVFRRAPLPAALGMVVTAIAYRYGAARCCLFYEPVTRQLPAFLDDFAFGMLAAYGVVWARDRFPSLTRYRTPFTIAALALACAASLLLGGADAVTYDAGGREHWIAANRTLFACVTASFIFVSCFSARWWRALVANPVLVFLSLVSYNLYLWHTMVMIWLWKHDIPHAATPDPHADDHWKLPYIAFGWSLSLAISTAITYFIERPLLGKVHRREPFAFAWRAFGHRFGLTKAPPIATSETRT